MVKNVLIGKKPRRVAALMRRRALVRRITVYFE
jgi:hypothetical protein